MSGPHRLICWNCKTTNTDSDTFCLECGKLLNNLISDDHVDRKFTKLFNISRSNFSSQEFTVTNTNQNKFTIQTKVRSHDLLFQVFGYGLLIVLSFTISILVIVISVSVLNTQSIYFSIALIGNCILFFSPFLFYPSIENARFSTEIYDSVRGQLVGKVKPRDYRVKFRHHTWIFTSTKDGKALQKYSLKFSTKTNGSIHIEGKQQFYHTYYFIRSDKGLAPEIDLFLDKSKVVKLLLGPEYEKIGNNQGTSYTFYERSEFQLLAQDFLHTDVVLFFATVIINNFTKRDKTLFSKYFSSF